MSSAADVLIVGAGIAGCEAAWRCAAADLDVVLVTTSLDTVYALASTVAPLTPPAGSLLERVAAGLGQDAAGTRSWDLHRAVKYAIEASARIHLLQSTVSELLLDERGSAVGARTWEGVDRPARSTALCVGSFLRARLRSGAVTETQGRLSEMAYDDLYQALTRLGFEFAPVRFTGEAGGGALAYVVESVVLAASERSPARTSSPYRDRVAGPTAELWRVPRLFAAGVCVAPPAEAGAAADLLKYEDAVVQGMALGDELVARSRASAG